MQTEQQAKLRLLLSMAVFGTIGLFVRGIPLPSAVIAAVRGIAGAAFLLLLSRLHGAPPSRADIRRNLVPLCASGAAMGVNWILLFESYRYTSVATATLCYYMAPVFVILASPVLLKERLSVKKVLCVAAALVGVAFVSGVPENGLPRAAEARGILSALGAAVLYAVVILINKRIRGISAYDKTTVQLFSAFLTITPYVLLTGQAQDLHPGAAGLVLLAVVAVFHTGVCYALYFGSLEALSAQTVAVFSYLDPVVAVLLSALVLREPLTLFGILGAVLILGAAVVSDLTA